MAAIVVKQAVFKIKFNINFDIIFPVTGIVVGGAILANQSVVPLHQPSPSQPPPSPSQPPPSPQQSPLQPSLPPAQQQNQAGRDNNIIFALFNINNHKTSNPDHPVIGAGQNGLLLYFNEDWNEPQVDAFLQSLKINATSEKLPWSEQLAERMTVTFPVDKNLEIQLANAAHEEKVDLGSIKPGHLWIFSQGYEAQAVAANTRAEELQEKEVIKATESRTPKKEEKDPLVESLMPDINFQDVFGNTALHHAILRRDENETQRLIRQGANVTIKNRGGKSPSELAKEGNFLVPFFEDVDKKFIVPHEKIRILLRADEVDEETRPHVHWLDELVIEAFPGIDNPPIELSKFHENVRRSQTQTMMILIPTPPNKENLAMKMFCRPCERGDKGSAHEQLLQIYRKLESEEGPELPGYLTVGGSLDFTKSKEFERLRDEHFALVEEYDNMEDPEEKEQFYQKMMEPYYDSQKIVEERIKFHSYTLNSKWDGSRSKGISEGGSRKLNTLVTSLTLEKGFFEEE